MPQVKILETILKSFAPPNTGIRKISCHHPEKQLGRIAKSREIKEALSGLASDDFKALRLDLGLYKKLFRRGGYWVDKDKVMEVYRRNYIEKNRKLA